MQLCHMGEWDIVADVSMLETEDSPVETEECPVAVERSPEENGELLDCPTTPCKTKRYDCLVLAHHDSDNFETPEKLALVETSTKPRARGRPKGKALQYGQSIIAHHQPRGRAGDLRSNRLLHCQSRVQHSWTSNSLVPVVHAVRKLCQVSDGKFRYGSFTLVKKQFPSMDLNDGTLRRCFFHGDAILADAKKITRSALGHHDRTSRQRKGMRTITSQGRTRSCVGPLYATGLWHHNMRALQVQIPRAALVAYFVHELETHKDILETVLESEPEHTASKHWRQELDAIRNRIRRFEGATGSARNKAINELERSLRVKTYAVQKRSDLTEAQQRRFFSSLLNILKLAVC